MIDIESLIAQSAAKIHERNGGRELLHGEIAPNSYWDAIIENGLHLAWASEESGGFGADLSEVAGAIWNMTPAPLPFVETLIANKLLELGGLELAEERASFAIGAADGTHIIPFAQQVDDVVLFSEGQIAHYKSSDLSGTALDSLSPDTDGVADFSKTNPINSAQTNISRPMIEAIILTLRSVQMAAALDGALSLSIDHVSAREQFGRPLSKFQAIQHQLAVAASQVAAANMAASQACVALSNNIESAWHEAVIAKVQISDSIEGATAAFQQVHGAIGYTMEYDLHLHTRRLWAWREALGTEHIWAQKLGDDLAQKDSDNLWRGVTTGAW